MLWNPCSLQNKLSILLALLHDEDIDFAAVTETWMTTQSNSLTAELKERGYSIYHYNRDIKKGGGVALIFKNHFEIVNAKTYNFETFECIHVSIKSTIGKPLNFIVIYRYCELTPSRFLTEIHDFIDSIFINFRNVIFLGDFNLHINDKYNPTVLKFQDILSSFGLNQIVDEATHNLGNTLDLVIHNPCDTHIKDLITLCNKSMGQKNSRNAIY